MNKLGNLVLLSRRKNSQAQNYDFKTKKEVYFSGGSRKNSKKNSKKEQVGSVAAFPTVTRVLNVGDCWTPEIVRKNQREYVSLLVNAWNL